MLMNEDIYKKLKMNSKYKKSIWHPHLHVISKDSSGNLIADSIFLDTK